MANDVIDRLVSYVGEVAANGTMSCIARQVITDTLLGAGPYEVRPCRNHWHITVGDHDVINPYGDALDEMTARRGAAEMNAEAMRRRETYKDALEEIARMQAAMDPDVRKRKGQECIDIALRALGWDRPGAEVCR